MGEKPIRERVLLVEQADHLLLLDDEDGARARRDGRRHPKRLSRQGPLTEEVARSQHRHDRFLAGVGNDAELHTARLDVKDAVAGVTLGEDDRSTSVLHDSAGDSTRFEKRPEVKRLQFRGLDAVVLGAHEALQIVTTAPGGPRPTELDT